MYNEKTLKEIPVEYSYMGYVQEDSLSQIYSASDAVVSSSLDETFGQTLVEAMACGCLPVSFDNSGQTDIIDHLESQPSIQTYLINLVREDMKKTGH